jgi:hypothetical protein
MFSPCDQNVERNDIVRARGVNVDQLVADMRISENVLGDEQPEQIICQLGVWVDQAATMSGVEALAGSVSSQGAKDDLYTSGS